MAFCLKRTRFCASLRADRTYFCVAEVGTPQHLEAYPFLRRTNFCETRPPAGLRPKAYPFLRYISSSENRQAYLLLRAWRGQDCGVRADVYVYARVPPEPALTVYGRKPRSRFQNRTRFCATFAHWVYVYRHVYRRGIRRAYPILRKGERLDGVAKRTRFCAASRTRDARRPRRRFRTRFCGDNVAHSGFAGDDTPKAYPILRARLVASRARAYPFLREIILLEKEVFRCAQRFRAIRDKRAVPVSACELAKANPFLRTVARQAGPWRGGETYGRKKTLPLGAGFSVFGGAAQAPARTTYTGVMFAACRPFGPFLTSNDTR